MRRGATEIVLVGSGRLGDERTHIESLTAAERGMRKVLIRRFKKASLANIKVFSSIGVVSGTCGRIAGGGKNVARNEGYQLLQLPATSDSVRQTFIETVSLVHGLFKGVNAGDPISRPELLLRVSDLLVDEATIEQKATGTAQAWQALVLKGLERKKAILMNSAQFKSVGEAAELLDVKDPAIRRRIRECRLFAVKSPDTDEYRIPVWALALTAEQTRDIHDSSGGLEAWTLYHFMSTPSNWLNGLRPFELLLPAESLTSDQQTRRREVARHFGAADANSLLDVVLKALTHEAPQLSEA